MLLYNDPGMVDIFYDEEVRAIRSKFYQLSFSGDELKKILLKVKDYFVTYKLHYWIVDNSEVVDTIQPEDAEWVMEIFFADLFTKGLTHCAYVRSKNPLSNASNKIFEEELAKLRIHTGIFNSQEDAAEWLIYQNG